MLFNYFIFPKTISLSNTYDRIILLFSVIKNYCIFQRLISLSISLLPFNGFRFLDRPSRSRETAVYDATPPPSPSDHLPSGFDRLNVDDFEVEEEIRPDFPCPYCYEDFDIGSLCSHLEDEHSCESRATICPVCSVKVTRDMLSHITLQHGHLFKLQRRRRLRRVAVPNSQALSLLGRDLREAHLQVLLGGSSGGGYRSSNITTSSSSVAASDPFLSSLVLNFPGSEAEEISKSIVSNVEENSVKSPTPQHIWKSSFDPSLSSEEREKKMRQATGRAVFLQDLLMSTLLTD